MLHAAEQLPVRIVGCGSAHGDDAAGWHLVRALQPAASGRPHVELHTVYGGHQILDLLDGRGTLIVVDAVSSGHPAGTIHYLRWPDVRAELRRPGSTHGFHAVAALQLAAAIDILPPRVVLFGIELAAPGRQKTGLTPAVAAALPRLAQHIIDEWLTDTQARAV